ncbi:MAG: DNA-formamidopyrimidine glycosylase family protein [Actinomycetota bacterium]
MPEGDTIHRTAARLRPALAGKTLVRFDAPRLTGDRPRPGEVIASVRAVGKHLLIEFERHLVLHTHMKMTGSWHLYRPGERWREPQHLARATVAVDDWIAVCFAAPVVGTYRDVAGVISPLAHLGPDLCLPDIDVENIAERCAAIAEPGTTIADVLLDQRIACGIGNVFKSETLWACRVSPFATLAEVDDATRRQLYSAASRQLRANLGGGPRTTVPGGLAVYGRQRQPCRRCRDIIRMRSHGDHARSTYWCPSCQPDPGLASPVHPMD